MNSVENIIYIENHLNSDIKNLLEQCIELYIDELDTNLKFKLYNIDKRHSVIEFNNDIDNVFFNYLVNYLTYPESIEYNTVKGYTLIKDIKIYPKNLLNLKIQISIPESQNEFDCVYGTTETGETIKIDFEKNTSKISSNVKYIKPTLNYKSVAYETIEINKKEIIEKKNNIKLKKFNIRFAFLSIAFLLITLLGGYITYDTDNFTIIIRISSFGLFFWTVLEHDLFHKDTVYLKLLLLSGMFTLGAYYLSNTLYNDFWLETAKLSFVFLVLHKILRFLYQLKYKREPEFEKTAEFFVDRVYTYILITASLVCMFI